MRVKTRELRRSLAAAVSVIILYIVQCAHSGVNLRCWKSAQKVSR
jgi:hypothetical protein